MPKITHVGQDKSHKTPGILPYIIFVLAASFYFYEYFLQISPSVMTKGLMRDLGISAATLGTVSAFYYYTYTLFQIPAGLLFDKYGARKILTLMVLLCAGGAFCFGISHGIWLASIGRLMMGAGSAFAFVGTLYLILRWFPARHFPIFTGLTQLMGSAGAIFGAAPMAILSLHLGWQKAMQLMSVLGVCLAVLIFLIVRNTPNKQANNPSASSQQNPSGSIRKNLIEVITNRQSWALAISSCLSWGPVAAFAGLWGVPFLARKYGIETISAGAMMAWVWIGIGTGSPLIGWVSEKLGRRLPPLFVVAAIGLASGIPMIYINHLPIWLCCICLYGMGLAATGQSLCFAIVADINPLSRSSAAIGFNNGCLVAGAIFSQPFIGHLLDYGWSGEMLNGARVYTASDYKLALIFIPACYLLNLIICKFFIKETYCQKLQTNERQHQ